MRKMTGSISRWSEVFDWPIARCETFLALSLRGPLSGRSLSGFLSPTGFANLADMAVGVKKPKLKVPAARTQVLFIGGHKLEEFLEKRPRELQPRVLLVGDGDRDWNEYPKVPSFVDKVYLQNLNVKANERFRVLPIGIESLEWGRNGLPWYLSAKYKNRTKEEKIMAGPFGQTHEDRKSLTNYLEQSDSKVVDFYSRRMSTLRLSSIMSRYKYVLCPRGNGLDTHRFWETLYRGSTPIVAHSTLSDNLKLLGIPLIDAGGMSITEIESAVSNPKDAFHRDVPALHLSYWEREFRS